MRVAEDVKNKIHKLTQIKMIEDNQDNQLDEEQKKEKERQNLFEGMTDLIEIEPKVDFDEDLINELLELGERANDVKKKLFQT